jgi:hypothetical protein
MDPTHGEREGSDFTGSNSDMVYPHVYHVGIMDCRIFLFCFTLLLFYWGRGEVVECKLMILLIVYDTD